MPCTWSRREAARIAGASGKHAKKKRWVACGGGRCERGERKVEPSAIAQNSCASLHAVSTCWNKTRTLSNPFLRGASFRLLEWRIGLWRALVRGDGETWLER